MDGGEGWGGRKRGKIETGEGIGRLYGLIRNYVVHEITVVFHFVCNVPSLYRYATSSDDFHYL